MNSQGKRRYATVVLGVAGISLAAIAAGVIGEAAAAAPRTPSASSSSTTCTGCGSASSSPAGDATGARRGQGAQASNRNAQGSEGAQAARRNGQGRPSTAGSGTAAAALPSGTLTADQKADLAFMAQEEKLAGDVYDALYAATGDTRFQRIAASEDSHLAALRTLMTRYGVSDPTLGAAAGQFADADLQALYTSLLAQGRASLTAALEVGRTVERKDIADLEAAAKTISAADVSAVYSNLLRASQQHLVAFGG